MLEVCPDAWFLNYTNPMAMNVWWLSVVAPRLKVVGLCHIVHWTVHGLCAQIGVPMEGTHFRAAGVNHQAWLTEWSRDGEDLYPRLREVIAADPELERRVRVELFRRVGCYPTETSEHSAEYLSWFRGVDLAHGPGEDRQLRRGLRRGPGGRGRRRGGTLALGSGRGRAVDAGERRDGEPGDPGRRHGRLIPPARLVP